MTVYPNLIIIQIVLYTLSVLPFFSILRCKSNGSLSVLDSQNYKKCIFFLGLIFCIFASFDGDWYHYQPIIEEVSKVGNNDSHIEPIQLWIIKNLSFGNYILWRLIIWGTTFVFIYLSLNRINQNNLITWSCFINVCALQMSTGRVYFGLAILLYGFCCIINRKAKYFSVLKGLMFFAISFLFHKSIFIYITAAIFALIYYRRWMVILVIVAIPIIIKIFTTFLLMYLMNGEDTHTASFYLEEDTLSTGIGMNIYYYIYRGSLILLLILFYAFSRHRLDKIQKYSQNIFQYALNIIYIYIIVYCALTLNNIGSRAISQRILIGSYYPISILFSIMIQHKYKLKLNTIIFISFYLINSYRLIYAYYVQCIGGGV